MFGFMKKWFKKGSDRVTTLTRAQQEAKFIKDTLGEVSSHNYAFSDNADRVLNHIMNLPRYEYQIVITPYNIVIKGIEDSYELWNENKYFAWLKTCYRCSKSRGREYKQIWRGCIPNLLTMAKFQVWLDSHDNIQYDDNLHFSFANIEELFIEKTIYIPEELFKID